MKYSDKSSTKYQLRSSFKSYGHLISATIIIQKTILYVTTVTNLKLRSSWSNFWKTNLRKFGRFYISKLYLISTQLRLVCMRQAVWHTSNKHGMKLCEPNFKWWFSRVGLISAWNSITDFYLSWASLLGSLRQSNEDNWTLYDTRYTVNVNIPEWMSTWMNTIHRYLKTKIVAKSIIFQLCPSSRCAI